MIGLGDVTYIKKDIFVQGLIKETVFKVQGSRTEQRVGFKLDGQQKAVLLQFGLEDLKYGTTDLTYLVKISADGKLLWAGDCRYGQKQQIVSVPLSIPGATSLLIEYTITVPGSTSVNSLYFTKAELLSN